ncbi:MAG: hypothetical protein KC505_09245 [Myxococcales bacterium]|nr:hypothetical protein [Myxococcales bacterium]USN50772.1 MAG: hypothetical protein H6731_11040 [Myxococcales bacterium]
MKKLVTFFTLFSISYTVQAEISPKFINNILNLNDLTQEEFDVFLAEFNEDKEKELVIEIINKIIETCKKTHQLESKNWLGRKKSHAKQLFDLNSGKHLFALFHFYNVKFFLESRHTILNITNNINSEFITSAEELCKFINYYSNNGEYSAISTSLNDKYNATTNDNRTILNSATEFRNALNKHNNYNEVDRYKLALMYRLGIFYWYINSESFIQNLKNINNALKNIDFTPEKDTVLIFIGDNTWNKDDLSENIYIHTLLPLLEGNTINPVEKVKNAQTIIR